jgi:hypothetical protein
MREGVSRVFDQWWLRSTDSRMTRNAFILIALLTCGLIARADETSNRASVIILVGTPGEDSYSETFTKWAQDWSNAAKAGNAHQQVIGTSITSRDSLGDLKQALEDEAKEDPNPLWIALLGHGTFDGKEPKFNLPGDDLKASELAGWLAPFRRPVVVVCGFSASGAWLKPMTGTNRIVVTATKSGTEINFARFGGFFATAIGDAAADLDKDGQTSVLEAWLSASQKVADFYKSDGRLATEHSLLEDNGDGLGTPANWFSGIRAIKKPKGNSQPDGTRAHQLSLVPTADERELSPELRQERDKLELELAHLREQKSALAEEEYFGKLEDVLVRIARLYHQERADRPPPAPPTSVAIPQ